MIAEPQVPRVPSEPIDDLLQRGEITREGLVDLLRTLCEIRSFEDKIYELYRAGALKGASHLSAGQEAVPLSVIDDELVKAFSDQLTRKLG